MYILAFLHQHFCFINIFHFDFGTHPVWLYFNVYQSFFASFLITTVHFASFYCIWFLVASVLNQFHFRLALICHLLFRRNLQNMHLFPTSTICLCYFLNFYGYRLWPLTSILICTAQSHFVPSCFLNCLNLWLSRYHDIVLWILYLLSFFNFL